MLTKRTTATVEMAPQGDTLTDYDRAQVKLYVRLLDAEASGAALADMAQRLFGIDAAADPECARNAVESHIARARWMTEVGYRLLLAERGA